MFLFVRQFNRCSLHKQTRRHSFSQLCMRTWKLWQLALENQIFLKAAHIAGKKNILADHLSRIPNPLFDLAGITCGHFLIPFWTFFGATLIGKAVIKIHIQYREKQSDWFGQH
ncbi:Hypothetical predicted protein, partial [Mytilus galloprovincialis]